MRKRVGEDRFRYRTDRDPLMPALDVGLFPSAGLSISSPIELQRGYAGCCVGFPKSLRAAFVILYESLFTRGPASASDDIAHIRSASAGAGGTGCQERQVSGDGICNQIRSS